MLRFGLSEPRVSSNSRPLFLSRTCSLSLESRKGDLRLRSLLRSRGLSALCSLGLRSLALGSLLSRGAAGDRDLLGCVTPRPTLPLSLRSSPLLQLLSFISTYREIRWFFEGIVASRGH